MSEIEGPPKPTQKPTPWLERTPLVLLSAEEARLLAIESIARRGEIAEDVLGLHTDFAKAALAPHAEAEDAPLVSDVARDVPTDAVVPSPDVNDPVPPLLGRRRRGTGKAIAKPSEVPVSHVSVSASPVSSRADAAVGGVGVSGEKEPIVLGRYRDQEGILCVVREEGGKYFYTPLEGSDKGQELPQGDAGNMRALMGGEWMKVDDATEPTPMTPSAIPDAVVVPTSSITPEAAPEPAMADISIPAPDGAVQAPLSRREQQRGEKEARRTEALEKLLEQLGGQTVFVLENPKTKAKTECQIDASGVITKKGESANQTSWVIDKLTLVTPWEVKIKKGSASTPDTKAPADPAVPPAIPDVVPVASASPDKPAPVDSKIESKFISFAPGGEGVYLDATGNKKIVRRMGDEYHILDTADEIMIEGHGYSEAQMKGIVDDNTWVPEEQGSTLADAAHEKKEQNYDELFQGDVWVVKRADGTREKSRHLTTILHHDGNVWADVAKDDGTTGTHELEVVRAELRQGGFILETHGYKSEKTKESVEGPKVTEDSEKQKEHMDNLLTEVKEARFAYVTTDYHQNSVWQKIKGIFGKSVGEHRGDVDTDSAKGRYELALMKLQDAQLGELKTLGLPQEVLRQRMGEMLNYYKIDERISLYNDRNRVKIESKNFPQRVVSAAENVGRWYNKLPRSAKYAIGGVGMAVSLLSGGGVITGGLAMTTSGLFLIKKLIGTAGIAVTVDTFIEEKMEEKRSETAEEEREAHLGILDRNKKGGEYDLNLMSHFLKRDIESLDEKFKAQKKEALIRRSVVWGAAVGGMVGIGATWMSHLNAANAGPSPDSGSHSDRVRNLLDRHPDAATTHSGIASASAATAAEHSASAPAAAASAAERAASAPVVGPVSGMSPRELAHFQEVNGVNPAEVSVPVSAVSPEMTARMAALRQEYTVTADDGKKGLWGIFEKQLPADMPKGEKNLVIARLEGTLQAKLHGMSPEQLKAVGFRTENIDKIYPGDRIALEKLLTPQEVQSAFESHGVPASVAEAVPAATHHAVDLTQPPSSGVASEAAQTTAHTAVAEAPHVVASVTPMDQAVFEDTVARLQEQPMVPLDQSVPHSDPTAAVRQAILEDRAHAPVRPVFEAPLGIRPVPMPAPEMISPQSFANPAQLSEYLGAHPEMTPSYQNTLRGMKNALFTLPQSMNGPGPYIEQVDGGMTFNMARANMDRVLETCRDLRHGVISEYEYNSRPFPFKSSQITRLAHLADAASHPKIFGMVGRPLPGEMVSQYVERMAALATALHKERELAWFLSR